jgi:hypothetical protein
MNHLPSISCICLAYGNSKQIPEAVQCFLDQDYAGKKHLIILNSFPRQTLIFNHPDVTIVNAKTRPASLGACRNFAISLSTSDIIVTWDSDDLWLGHHLTVVGEAFAESGADWVRVNPVFYSEGWKITRMFQTWINSVAFKKSAWDKVGRYPRNLSVGEDQSLWSAISSQCRGVTVELKPSEVSAIYCWGGGNFHISGKGWDKPNQVPAYERARIDLESRVAKGQEPVGEIVIEPKLTHDPSSMAREFLSRPAPNVKKNSVCVLQLGRYGDIINVLPIARHIAESYDTPHFMVAREFANILEGVSYVHPVVVDLRNDQVRPALEKAHREFRHVVNCAIWGTDWSPERKEQSFNREAWRMAGFNFRFEDKSPAWLPYFDKRDRTREAALVDKLAVLGKPILLVNVTRSVSSPFHAGEALFKTIHNQFSNTHTIVDCGTLRLHRLYDIIGLMEHSAALISIDTSLLHVAAATNIPVIALINPASWQGTECRANCVGRIPYNEASPNALIPRIEAALQIRHAPIAQGPIKAPPARFIFHSVERHDDAHSKTIRRKQMAWSSWDVLYKNGDLIPCHYWEPYKRNAKEELGDPRPLPYLKDCLEHAMRQAGDEDIILFTNDDNWIGKEAVGLIRLHCSLWGCVSSQRCEFHTGSTPGIGDSPDVWRQAGRLHMGRDLFAFTKRWLTDHWAQIPDMVIGCSDWDLMMACMIRLQWGIETSRANVEDSIWPAEMERGHIGHEYHPPKWADPKYEGSAPAQLHNRRNFVEWAKAHLPSLYFHPNSTI